MAACIRRAKADDLLQIQDCSQKCLSDGDAYLIKQFTIGILTWPHLHWVAEGLDGRIVGYVMADMDDMEGRKGVGYIRSIAVLQPYRRSGLASKLVNIAHSQLMEVYDAELVRVNVRQSNNAARNLFRNRLGYTEHELKNPDHFEDGEPAYVLWKPLRQNFIHDQPRPAGGGGGNPGEEEVGPANRGSP